MKTKKASIRFASLLSLILNACYMPSRSWWILLQSNHHDHDIPIENFDGKNLIWIQDEEDGKCLGPNGFGECGDLNLWEIWGSEGGFTLEHHSVGIEDDIDRKCLAREYGLGYKTKAHLQKCEKNPAASWDFSFTLGQLSNGKRLKRCLYREGNTAYVQACITGYTSLTPILHESQLHHPTTKISSSAHEYISINQKQEDNSGEWICPQTGLIFPHNLNDRLGESVERRQMFMGAGTYTQKEIEEDDEYWWWMDDATTNRKFLCRLLKDKYDVEDAEYGHIAVTSVRWVSSSLKEVDLEGNVSKDGEPGGVLVVRR
eukprot:gene4315-8582_t